MDAQNHAVLYLLGVPTLYKSITNKWFSVIINKAFGGVLIFGVDPSLGASQIRFVIARNYANVMSIVGEKGGRIDSIKIKDYTYYFHEPSGNACFIRPICGDGYTIEMGVTVPSDAQDVTL